MTRAWSIFLCCSSVAMGLIDMAHLGLIGMAPSCV